MYVGQASVTYARVDHSNQILSFWIFIAEQANFYNKLTRSMLSSFHLHPLVSLSPFTLILCVTPGVHHGRAVQESDMDVRPIVRVDLNIVTQNPSALRCAPWTRGSQVAESPAPALWRPAGRRGARRSGAMEGCAETGTVTVSIQQSQLDAVDRW